MKFAFLTKHHLSFCCRILCKTTNKLLMPPLTDRTGKPKHVPEIKWLPQVGQYKPCHWFYIHWDFIPKSREESLFTQTYLTEAEEGVHEILARAVSSLPAPSVPPPIPSLPTHTVLAAHPYIIPPPTPAYWKLRCPRVLLSSWFPQEIICPPSLLLLHEGSCREMSEKKHAFSFY